MNGRKDWGGGMGRTGEVGIGRTGEVWIGRTGEVWSEW